MRIIGLVALLYLSGCSIHWQDRQGFIQHRGLLWYQTTVTDRIRFFELQTVGFQLRLQPDDPGVSLGYRKLITLSAPPEPANAPGSEQGLLVSRQPDSKAALQLTKQIGLEAGGGRLGQRFSLGYDRTVMIEGPKPGESSITKIDFREQQPLATSVFQMRGGS